MSHATVAEKRANSATIHAADSFSKSVVLISVLMVVQRGIGFLRSFYVCGSLSPTEIGRWDLAFSFLMLAAPLAVFGIPGSFGRYVARYEQNGQQSRFLRQTLAVCLVLTAIGSLAVWLLRESVSRYFFGSDESVELVTLLSIGLPVVVFFNFATSWFSGKRLNRFVFRIQFVQTLFFALLCVVTFNLVSDSAYSVVVSYLLSCLVGTGLAAGYTLFEGSSDHDRQQAQASDPIWRKILPFAVWVWVSNALYNLFAVCDRLLLVNFYPDKSLDIEFLVGQYHTACIFPLLLTTIGAMAGSTVMPYLSKDWESGDHDSVADRMNTMLKAMGLFCVVTSAAILLTAPILFGLLWNDKFVVGESLLPMALCYCSLATMTMIAQNYFWCIEKTWISSAFLLIGLISNFVVGMALIGRYGIDGVVASTLVSHAIVLGGVLLVSQYNGLRINAGVFVVSAAIFTLCLGKAIALLCMVLLLTTSIFTPLLFSDAVRRDAWAQIRARLFRHSLG